jgi:NTE family protein
MLMDSIARGEIRGVLLRMGNSTRNLDVKSGFTRPSSQYDDFSSEADVAVVANHPTDLNALSPAGFDRIARHGYEVADTTLTAHAPRFS